MSEQWQPSGVLCSVYILYIINEEKGSRLSDDTLVGNIQNTQRNTGETRITQNHSTYMLTVYNDLLLFCTFYSNPRGSREPLWRLWSYLSLYGRARESRNLDDEKRKDFRASVDGLKKNFMPRSFSNPVSVPYNLYPIPSFSILIATLPVFSFGDRLAIYMVSRRRIREEDSRQNSTGWVLRFFELGNETFIRCNKDSEMESFLLHAPANGSPFYKYLKILSLEISLPRQLEDIENCILWLLQNCMSW